MKDALASCMKLTGGICPYAGLKSMLMHIEKDDANKYAELCVEIEKLNPSEGDIDTKLISLIVDCATSMIRCNSIDDETALLAHKVLLSEEQAADEQAQDIYK